MQLPIFESTPIKQLKNNSEDISQQARTQDPIVEVYEHIWASFPDVLRTHQESLSKLSLIERTANPAVGAYSVVETIEQFDIDRAKSDLAKRIEERLVEYASKCFTIAGVTINLDVDALRKESRADSYRGRPPFSVSKFWKLLESKYGNGKGLVLAWQQAAQKLYRAFHLEGADSIERKAGYVVLNQSAYTDGSRAADGSTKYHSTHTRSIAETFQALAAFCRWAEDHTLADLLLDESGKWNWDRWVKTQERHHFGRKKEVIVITFFQRVEFRLAPSVAQSLQLFIADHRDQEAR